MIREWQLSHNRRLVVSVNEGDQDYDRETQRWVDVVWMLVMWFPPSGLPGSIESGQAIGGQTRREAFAKMRHMLATQAPPSLRFVEPEQASGVWELPAPMER